MFWMYGFDKTQPYPLKNYVNYMDNNLYRKVVSGLQVADNIMDIVNVAQAYLEGFIDAPVFVTGSGKTSTGESIDSIMSSAKSSRSRVSGKEFLAIHVRRGDYWNKCKRIKDLRLRAHCYPSSKRIEQVIEDYLESRRLLSSQQDIPDKQITIYIATNLGSTNSEFENIANRYNVHFYSDIFLSSEKQSGMDPSQMALIDVELCSRATMFFGNFYSSFSRSIFEQRELRGHQYASF